MPPPPRLGDDIPPPPRLGAEKLPPREGEDGDTPLDGDGEEGLDGAMFRDGACLEGATFREGACLEGAALGRCCGEVGTMLREGC